MEGSNLTLIPAPKYRNMLWGQGLGQAPWDLGQLTPPVRASVLACKMGTALQRACVGSPEDTLPSALPCALMVTEDGKITVDNGIWKADREVHAGCHFLLPGRKRP